MFLDHEALDQARTTVDAHADALASALQERTSLDGIWGLVGKLWGTHAADVAAADQRIAWHHQQLREARDRLQQLEERSRPHPTRPRPEGPDVERVARWVLESEHPSAPELRSLDDELATLDAAHTQKLRMHRAAAALVAAGRARAEPTGSGLTGLLAGWLNRDERAVAELRSDLAAACRDAFEDFTRGSLASEVDQAALLVARLQEEAIQHRQERRVLESRRAELLDELRPSLPSTFPTSLTPNQPGRPSPPGTDTPGRSSGHDTAPDGEPDGC